MAGSIGFVSTTDWGGNLVVRSSGKFRQLDIHINGCSNQSKMFRHLCMGMGICLDVRSGSESKLKFKLDEIAFANS